MNYLFNLLILLALVVCPSTFGDDVIPNNCKAAQILRLLTRWRNGDVPILPPLDVIKLPSVEGRYDGYGVKVSYATGDMQLTGASDFAVEDIQIKVYTKGSKQTLVGSAKVHFPLLILTSDQYNVQGRAYYMYSLKGSGLMNVTFQTIDLTVGATLVSKKNSEQIDDINLNFNIGKIQVSLADSSWPLNKVLNSQAMNIVENHRSAIETAAKEILQYKFNEFLATTSSVQLLSTTGDDCA